MFAARVWIAMFSFLVMALTALLVPFAWFGDNNPVWAKRLARISFSSGLIFLASLFL